MIYANLCNLGTYFKASITKKNKNTLYSLTTVNHERIPGPCFGSLLNELNLTNNDNYKNESLFGSIELFFCDSDKLIENSRNNFCFFNENEITLWLNFIKKIVNYSYVLKKNGSFTVRDNMNDIVSGYYMTINIEDLSYIEFKYLLTMIRYLWEQPASLILKDVLNLIQLGVVKTSNIFNVYNFISMGVWINSGQDMNFGGIYYPPITIKELKKKITFDRFNKHKLNILFLDEYNEFLNKPMLADIRYQNNSKQGDARIKQETIFDIHKLCQIEGIDPISSEASLMRYKSYYSNNLPFYKGTERNIISFKKRFDR